MVSRTAFFGYPFGLFSFRVIGQYWGKLIYAGWPCHRSFVSGAVAYTLNWAVKSLSQFAESSLRLVG